MPRASALAARIPRESPVRVWAIAFHGTVLIVLLALTLAAATSMPLDGDGVRLLAVETVLLPCLLGVGLVVFPASAGIALRWAVALWAVAQAASVPFTPWPMLVLAPGASLAGYLVVASMLATRAATIVLTVEPAFLPTFRPEPRRRGSTRATIGNRRS